MGEQLQHIILQTTAAEEVISVASLRDALRNRKPLAASHQKNRCVSNTVGGGDVPPLAQVANRSSPGDSHLTTAKFDTAGYV